MNPDLDLNNRLEVHVCGVQISLICTVVSVGMSDIGVHGYYL